jgi:SAM-dependent methyltransferase
MTADKLDLFDALSEEPQGAAALAERLSVDASVLAALLRALVSIGLVDEGDGAFRSTPFANDHLRNGADLALVVAKEAFFARAWLSLVDVVQTGRPTLDPWKVRLRSDPATAHMFLAALDVLAEHTGPRLWEMPELSNGRRVLDVGGGFGYYARRLAEAGAAVVLVDLPEVIDAVRARVADHPIDLVAADVTIEASCGVVEASVDTALVSHMLHDLSVEEGVELLERVRRAIRPGGDLVVNDFAVDAGPGPFGPMFDVMMRVETGGAAHPVATLTEMIESAGFSEVRRVDAPPPLTLFVGRRL